ncbi:MAG: roadblock/LC7 domain-containing protein [Promethearchaeota archaeon]|jgi:predicted regulator of Ras-like GTPase activity (Roadblock/LC7/MglB family)
MIDHIPKVLYKNKITEVLDDIRFNYGKLTRKGFIYGIIAIDQDAKIIAIDSRFDRKLNYWDLSSIGAALYGVARQGQDFFETENLERATIIYSDMRLFVKSIGEVNVQEKGKRDILIVLLTNNDVNLGVIFLQLSNFAMKIKKEIEENQVAKKTMKMSEKELKKHIKELKKQIFSDKLGTIS